MPDDEIRVEEEPQPAPCDCDKKPQRKRKAVDANTEPVAIDDVPQDEPTLLRNVTPRRKRLCHCSS